MRICAPGGEKRAPQEKLRALQHRILAAAWFAAFGFIAAAIFFLHRPIAWRAVILYLVLPSLSAGAAGYAWGAPLLDPNNRWGKALLRSLGVTAGAYAIFALLFALGLPLLERGWSLLQVPGLLVMTLTLGLLMVGRWVLFAGIAAGLTLHKLGRSRFLDPGPEPSAQE